jgi:DNA replication protein DnaC
MAKLSEINDKPEEFMNALKTFVANPRGYLILAGKNGNGKSFSARAIFEYFSGEHGENLFWNMAKLYMFWQEEIRKFGEVGDLLRRILKAPLLVLDDLGTRKPSDAFMDFLYWIADQRYENRENCGTIITTNLTSQSMREMFGDAFVSRVSSGICVRNDRPDRRSSKF